MAVTHIGTTGANANTVTAPAHVSGDLFIAKTISGSTTPPSLPAGWTNIGTISANVGIRWCYIVATSSAQAVGTHTNAIAMSLSVYRGAAAPTGFVSANGSSAAVNYPATTMSRTDGTSWVLRGCQHAAATDTNSSTLSGYTGRTGASAASGNGTAYNAQFERTWDSNGGLSTNPAAATQTVNTSGAWGAATMVIPDATPAPKSGLLAMF